ncbi:YfbM family protein [Trichothermofontia sp.]
MSMIGNLRMISDDGIDRLLAEPEAIYAIVDSVDDPEDNNSLTLDKAWHVIHYLLTGETWGGAFPEGFLLVGGTPIGEEDVGYGPARAFRASEVAILATTVASLDDPTFCDRFSVKRLQAAGIYPSFGNRSDAEECSYFLAYFQQLRTFLQQAAASQQGLLVYLD